MNPTRLIRNCCIYLLMSKNVVSITHAGILGVFRDQPWTYPSCICHEELVVRRGVYECVKCDRFFYKMIRRYRLKLEVFDGGNKAVFFLNDAQVKDVLNMLPADIFSPLDLDLDSEYPVEVERQVVGRDMLFKVSKVPGLTFIGYPCYEVMRVCSDPEITSVFLSEVNEVVGDQFVQAEVSVSKRVKRKLKLGTNGSTDNIDVKLGKVEGNVLRKLEFGSDDVSSCEDGMIFEINRLEALKISDGFFGISGSEFETSLSSTSGSKVQDMV
ncbi:uncharacterized protein LOC130726954 isoform X2 [Lotus japonicus]|uniref:uncharacterized protein LOC130726954 isoform X2 n=1 Tax=Lotus japonicus TaxID=34305 RepID=UPI0025883A97|nr:uncharacterized protein LOC130726954 isoform X2 [Lotus japonicus]